MLQPWENDPFVGDAAPAGNLPWDKDPIAPIAKDVFASIPDAIKSQVLKIAGGGLQILGSTTGSRVLDAATSRVLPEGPSPETRILGEDVSDMAGEVEKDAAKIADPKNMSFWQRASQNAAVSMALTGPALATSVIMRNVAPAVVTGASMQLGSSYSENREKGVPDEQAFGRAGVDAVAEGAMEMIPAKFLVDNIGAPTLKLLMKYLGKELYTESLTTAVQNANQQMIDMEYKGKEFSWEDWGQAILDTAGATAISAPILGAGAKGLSAAQNAGDRLANAPLEIDKIRELDLRDQPIDGGNNVELPPPFTHPTENVPAEAIPSLNAILDSIDKASITPEQVAEDRAAVAAHEQAKRAPVSPAAQMQWAPLNNIPKETEDAGDPDFFTSKKKADAAALHDNPNTGARSETPLLFGPEGQDIEGKIPDQVDMRPGVYTLGVPSSDRSIEYLRAVHDTVEQWRQKWLPNTTFVISNEQLFNNTALGWHSAVAPNLHLIVPATNILGTRTTAEHNSADQRRAFYNLSHEFGHALITDQLYGLMDPKQAAAIRQASIQGVVPPELLVGLDPKVVAVIQEFNAVKQRILANTMNADEFIKTWFSPGKVAMSTLLEKLKVAPTDTALSVVKAIARNARAKGMRRPGISAITQGAINNFLSLDEYAAEQNARYAYLSKQDTSTPLGQFFSGALASLRKFFASLKGGDGVIAPGVAFKEWIEGLGQTERAIDPGIAVTKAKKGGKTPKKKTVAKPKETGEPKEKKPRKKKTLKPVETVQHNVETEIQEPHIVARKLLNGLVEAGTIDKGDVEYEVLIGFLRDKDWAEFKEAYATVSGKSVQFELDYHLPPELRAFYEDNLNVLRAGIPKEQLSGETRAEAIRMWKELGFKSPYFKAWFGDWENDAGNASKVRKGVYFTPQTPLSLLERGDVQVSVEGGTEPLVVYHASNARGVQAIGSKKERIFEKFTKGDIGFHFGTVRAAHIRVLGNKAVSPTGPITNLDEEELKSKMFIIPSVLNLRNPLYIGHESSFGWNNVYATTQWLEAKGYITLEERENAIQAGQILLEEGARTQMSVLSAYTEMAPVRDMLVNKGYDGIIYENDVEGDTSFVAFHPNQVKSLLGSVTFSRSSRIDMELDFDAATSEGVGVRKHLNGIKNFLGDYPRLRRAVRNVKDAIYHALELQQLAHLHPEWNFLSRMTQYNAEFNRYKSSWQAAAEDIANRWKDLGKENFAKVNRFIDTEVSEGVHWFTLEKTQIERNGQMRPSTKLVPNETSMLKAAEFGLDEETVALVLEAKNDVLSRMNELEFVLFDLLATRYASSPEVLLRAARPLAAQFEEIRNKPYFPRGRFGNRVLLVEKKNDSGGWEVVYCEHFEDPVEWEKAYQKALTRTKNDERVQKHSLTDQSYTLMALPLEFADLAASELGLSAEQLDVLMNILQPAKADKYLSAFDQQRLGLKGYSSDYLRSFISHGWHNSNIVAKLIYRSKFNATIREATSALREARLAQTPESFDQVLQLEHVETFMKRTRDYVMAPPNEAQMLRSFVSISYLGLNIKTALLNTFGLMTTLSDLTTRMGIVEGTKLFTQASYSTLRSIKLLDLNNRQPGDYLSPEQQKALDRAIKEGVLSQSYAYHLAAMANDGNLYRLPAVHTGRQLMTNAIDVAMYVFRLTELSTRRATFIAQFEAAKKENRATYGMDPSFEDTYQLAIQKTSLLQNDYSLGNRVPFMRGFKIDKNNPLGKYVEPLVPLATVFMSFAQHMAFHTYGGYELGERRIAQHAGETPRTIVGGYTMKLWIILLFLAGYEGLPGAENLIDALEILWRKYGDGTPVRQKLREVVQGVEIAGNGLNPDSISRGLGHNVAGFDLSRSIGAGRFIPGTDTLAHPRNSMTDQVGALVLDLAGPTGGVIKFGLETLDGNKSSKDAFSKFPGGLGNMYTAYRWSQEGALAPSRGKITFDLETGILRDLTTDEIWGKALGFNPTVVSQNREIRFEQHDRQIYWQARRKFLVDDLWKAVDQRDREAQADARKAITEFNIEVSKTQPGLKLTGVQINRSLQIHRKNKRLDETDRPRSKMYRDLNAEIRGSHGVSEPDDLP